MKINLFDRYDIRTRICAFIFVVSPFLLDAYILVDAFRNLSSTVILSVILISGSGLVTCWMRYLGNKVNQVDYIAEYLGPNSTAVDPQTKDRYYTKLMELEPNFANLRSDDLAVCHTTAKDVSIWLKEKTREEKFCLIHEENLNYGFVRNLYAVKFAFLSSFTVYNIILLVLLLVYNWELSPKEYFRAMPTEHVACGLINIAFYLIWMFGINKILLDFTAKKYAKSVLGAINKL